MDMPVSALASSAPADHHGNRAPRDGCRECCTRTCVTHAGGATPSQGGRRPSGVRTHHQGIGTGGTASRAPLEPTSAEGLEGRHGQEGRQGHAKPQPPHHARRRRHASTRASPPERPHSTPRGARPREAHPGGSTTMSKRRRRARAAVPAGPQVMPSLICRSSIALTSGSDGAGGQNHTAQGEDREATRGERLNALNARMMASEDKQAAQERGVITSVGVLEL
jgi:hypothetical protein